VPLSKIQSEILVLLAAHRNPESYVAGAVPLNRDGPRYSDDIDIFHDREESVAAAAAADAALLAKEGFAGFSPESLIAEIRRNARYLQDDYADLTLTEPVDAGTVARRLRAALESAEAFVLAMPAGKEGLLFLKDHQVAQPDPTKLGDYTEHAGRRQGHWPSSSEIGGAMLDRYR
jgi:hypothetical protein